MELILKALGILFVVGAMLGFLYLEHRIWSYLYRKGWIGPLPSFFVPHMDPTMLPIISPSQIVLRGNSRGRQHSQQTRRRKPKHRRLKGR